MQQETKEKSKYINTSAYKRKWMEGTQEATDSGPLWAMRGGSWGRM